MDDDLLDGTQTVTFDVSAAGFVSATAQIDVVDHEQLSLMIENDTVDESVGSVDVTLRRSNTDVSEELVVDLAANNDDAIVLPESVSIPTGAMEVMFKVEIVDNFAVNDDVSIRLNAGEDRYQAGTLDLTILNDDNYSWTNKPERFDVNDDGFITPLDALIIINDLNGVGARLLPELTMATDRYLDVNEDKFVTPSDALQVINLLNADGEGEQAAVRYIAGPWIGNELEDDERERIELIDVALSEFDY